MSSSLSHVCIRQPMAWSMIFSQLVLWSYSTSEVHVPFCCDEILENQPGEASLEQRQLIATRQRHVKHVDECVLKKNMNTTSSSSVLIYSIYSLLYIIFIKLFQNDLIQLFSNSFIYTLNICILRALASSAMFCQFVPLELVIERSPYTFPVR